MNPMLIIAGVVAFVLGLAGGTAVRVMTAPKHAVVAAAADSTHAVHGKGAHADSGAALAHAAAADTAAHAADPHAMPAAEGAPDAHAVDAHAAAAKAPVVERVKPAPAAVDPADQAQAFKSVGNILLNMKPAETGKILEYMSDDHVEGILRQMGPRQAAVVLAQLPAERAAGLSRRLLHPKEDAK